MKLHKKRKNTKNTFEYSSQQEYNVKQKGMLRMLIQFSVENYKSIKERIYFNLLANNDGEHPDYTMEAAKDRVLKAAAVYGANASGKSNLFDAMKAAILMIRLSNQRQITDPLPMIPFAFDEAWKKQPSSFDFIFEAKGIRYSYGFSADREKVYSEYLYVYHTAKPTKIFERTDCDVYSITVKEKKLKEITEKNTANKLFLATATAWNYKGTEDAFRWFANHIEICEEYGALKKASFDCYEQDDDGALKSFSTRLLMHADFNISDYNFVSDIISGDEIWEMLPNEVRVGLTKPLSGKKIELNMLHRFCNSHGDPMDLPLSFELESKGTKNIFYFAPALMEVLKNGKTLVIDEIDNSLHPLLVEYILQLFYDPEINKSNAQLIFNTHDVNLLNLDHFRRDQIYFTEKNPEDGSTDLYSLAEFSPRKTENIQKGYLQGRYGAVPIIHGGDGLW